VSQSQCHANVVPISREALRNMLSKKRKRKILLGTLTVVSLVMVLGTGISAYSSWIALQRAVQQQTEALKKSQAEELLTRIRGAEQVLPRCRLTPAERAEVNSTLTKAINELKINGDIQAAQALFDSVRSQLPGNCPDIVLPTTTQNTVATIATETTVLPATQVSLAFLLLFLAMAFVSYELAVAWRSEHRRNKAALEKSLNLQVKEHANATRGGRRHINPTVGGRSKLTHTALTFHVMIFEAEAVRR
jgi:hypothetical protein